MASSLPAAISRRRLLTEIEPSGNASFAATLSLSGVSCVTRAGSMSFEIVIVFVEPFHTVVVRSILSIGYVNTTVVTTGVTMSRTDTQLKFRIPPDLKPKLEKAARANKRSINMEVVARLEQSFKIERQDPTGASGSAPQSLGMPAQGNTMGNRLTEVERDLAYLKKRVAQLGMAEIRSRRILSKIS